MFPSYFLNIYWVLVTELGTETTAMTRMSKGTASGSRHGGDRQ